MQIEKFRNKTYRLYVLDWLGKHRYSIAKLQKGASSKDVHYTDIENLDKIVRQQINLIKDQFL